MEHGKSIVTNTVATEAPFGSNEPGEFKQIEPSYFNALPYYLPLLIFPLLILSAMQGGWWLVAPFLYMSLSTFLDPILGQDGRNMDPTNTPTRRLIWHNLPVWTWAVVWPPTLIYCLWCILISGHLVLWECVVLAVLLGMEAQAIFIVGHELIHRRSNWERKLAEFLLACASYPQYAMEHVYIHHALVGTPDDDGSPPKGLGFWTYFPREVASNLTNAWRVAKERLVRKKHAVWHYSNPFWRYGLFVLFWWGLVYWMGGVLAVALFVFFGMGCVFSMKLSNYFQHYGLRRVRLANGRWEKIQPRHSWSADWRFSNWMFFNVQRHADHHAMASRHYPLLQMTKGDESPLLPGTYSDMMNLVIRPKRWFEKMDPIVDQWREYFYPEIDDWSPYDSRVAGQRPESFDAIIEIYGLAPRLAQWIENHPELLDNLQNREFTDLDLPQGFGPDLETEMTARQGLTRLYWTFEMDLALMEDQISELPIADSSDAVESMRNWGNDKAFQISMHVLRGNLKAVEAKIAYSNLAEATVKTVTKSVITDLEEVHGSLGENGFAVYVLRELASHEIYPGSHIRVLIIHDNERSKSMDRLGTRLGEALKNLADDNLQFGPCSNDQQYCMVSSIQNLPDLCRSEDLNVYLDLARMSCIYLSGNTSILEKIQQRRTEILDAPNQRESMLTQLKHTLADNRPETSTISQNLALIDRSALLILLGNNAVASDLGLAPQASKVLEHTGISELPETASFFSELRLMQAIVGGIDFDLANANQKTRELVATACGIGQNESLDEVIQTKTTKLHEDLHSIVNNV